MSPVPPSESAAVTSADESASSVLCAAGGSEDAPTTALHSVRSARPVAGCVARAAEIAASASGTVAAAPQSECTERCSVPPIEPQLHSTAIAHAR